MSDKKIKITISPIGKPIIEAEGYQGQGCAEATKAIEDALAGGTGGVEKTYKPEWEENAYLTQDEEQKQEGGW